MDRRRIVALAIVVVVLAAGGGWIVGSRVQSPAEIAAQTAAPDPSPILVPAESRVLATTIVTRGTGQFGNTRELTVAPSALTSEPRIATSLAAPGTVLEEGDELMTVNGRPVVLLAGSQPSFRDLGVGVTGDDVLQLEEALMRLGLDPGQIDGMFDAATASAVTAWYEQRGTVPLSATRSQLDELLPVEARLRPGGTPTGGVLVPAGEIVFVDSFPIRLTEPLVTVGQELEGAVANISDASVAVESSVPVEEAALLREGMKVMLDEPDLGIEATGVVSLVAGSPGTDDVDGFHVYFEVTVDDAPPALVNASVRLTIPVETTGDPVLAVPITALTLAGDGTSRVQRAGGDGLELLEVEPGLSAQGYVAVTPVGNDLAPGDLVLIGFDRGGSGDGGQ